MPDPKITVLLCTVRPDQGYVNHPEWHTIGKVVEDLSRQTFQDFELVVVDGLAPSVQTGEKVRFAVHREDQRGPDWWKAPERLSQEQQKSWPHHPRKHLASDDPEWVNEEFLATVAPFPYFRFPPRETLWTRARKVAISAYRNTGIAAARGELIVNLDDCCALPPDYLHFFWSAWERHKTCISPIWRDSGDSRPQGRVQSIAHDGEMRPVPGIYGFGSYPREIALDLNGYDEAFDGGQGLEDADWSVRLHQAGVRQALVYIPGFKIHAQTGHDPRAIDLDDPIVKCCNRAWHAQRVRRHVGRANEAWLWEDRTWLDVLVKPPCPLLLEDGTCAHHMGQAKCAYPKLATEHHPVADEIYDKPPVVNLRRETQD